MIRFRSVSSPVGQLVLSGDDALTGIRFAVHRGVSPVGPGWRRDPTAFREAVDQLGAWFAGERSSFALDVRVEGTPFQRRVWAALDEIPYGRTCTYTELASRLGTSARAVGSANACNPLSIVVPCHRLVGTSGLAGYAGGLTAKRWLLDHEAAMAENVGDLSLQP